MSLSLWRQTDPAFQFLKPRIGPQDVHSGVELQEHQAGVAILVSLVEPLECLVGVSQCGIDKGDFVGAYAVRPDSSPATRLGFAAHLRACRP